MFVCMFIYVIMYLCLFESNMFDEMCDYDTLYAIPQGSAVFDFSGTGIEVYGNCNAPRAVTLSAIIYCLRCMVGHDVPLNQVTMTTCHLHTCLIAIKGSATSVNSVVLQLCK